jgi:hypothetical protein
MMDIDSLTTRQLQLEISRILSSMSADNNRLSKFNKMTNHDSVSWYKNVLKWYISEYGDLPSKIGPGKNIKLLHEDL